MDFKEVRAFFESWGLYPTNEDCGDLNAHVIAQGINRRCYENMMKDAMNFDHVPEGKVSGLVKRKIFVERWVTAQDDAYYLDADTWVELERDWLGQGSIA